MTSGVFQLGSLSLGSNLFLSPLAGYTNLPFRLVLRELGGLDLCTTDLVNARSLLEKRDAALMLEARGVASVDINMGCPVRKVCRVGGGSAMMTELGRTQRLVGMMVEALKIPVTAKMRLGWDDENITAPDLAQALEDVGMAAVFVHGRTREQGFGGRVIDKNGYMVEVTISDTIGVYIVGGPDYDSTLALIPREKWTHIAVSYDGAQMKYYINGVLMETLPATTRIPAQTNALTIGNEKAARGHQRPMYGALDDLKLYNRVLTEAEILQGMNRGI